MNIVLNFQIFTCFLLIGRLGRSYPNLDKSAILAISASLVRLSILTKPSRPDIARLDRTAVQI